MNGWMNETQREIMWKKKNFKYMKDRNERQKGKNSKKNNSKQWMKKKNERINEKWMNTSKCQNKWMEIKKI